MSKVLGFLETHPTMTIGIGVVGVLLIGGLLMKKSSSQPGFTTQNAMTDHSGLTNGGLVYVPTSTSFDTYTDYSGASITTTTQTNAPSTTTTTYPPAGPPPGATPSPGGPYPGPPWVDCPREARDPITGKCPPLPRQPPGPVAPPPPIVPPTRRPPVPPPNPPTHSKGLAWAEPYSIRRGDTLSLIAAARKRKLIGQGAPSSISFTWHDIYGHNKGTIDTYAHQHGHYGDEYNWIYPGERIVLPNWQ